jgi:hypothetical protein
MAGTESRHSVDGSENAYRFVLFGINNHNVHGINELLSVTGYLDIKGSMVSWSSMQRFDVSTMTFTVPPQ